MRIAAVASFLLCFASAGCDRNLEPFDPDEQARQPDLSKIFPEGADRAEPAPPVLPPLPGEGRGAPPLAAEAGPAAGASDTATGQASADAVRGRVQVDPALGDARPARPTLFIIARRAAGGPPLAVKRVADPSFPLEFRLGPEDRMIQQMPFAGPLTLSARLDGDGDAISRSQGDLQGSAEGQFEPGAAGIVITLDERL